MHFKGHGLLVLVAIVLCSTCCGVPYMIYSAVTPPRVVPPPSPPPVSGFTSNGTYRLVVPFVLVKRTGEIAGDFPQYMIVPTGDEGYDPWNPGNQPQVVSALPAGQFLRFQEVRYVQRHTSSHEVLWWLDDLVTPREDQVEAYPLFWMLANGKVDAIGLVDGSAISSTIPSHGAEPNPDYLDRVPSPTTSP